MLKNIPELKTKRSRLRRQLEVLHREKEEISIILDDLSAQLETLNVQIAAAEFLRRIPEIQPLKIEME
jgi:chromosome segregation ATPase